MIHALPLIPTIAFLALATLVPFRKRGESGAPVSRAWIGMAAACVLASVVLRIMFYGWGAVGAIAVSLGTALAVMVLGVTILSSMFTLAALSTLVVTIAALPATDWPLIGIGYALMLATAFVLLFTHGGIGRLRDMSYMAGAAMTGRRRPGMVVAVPDPRLLPRGSDIDALNRNAGHRPTPRLHLAPFLLAGAVLWGVYPLWF